MDILSKIGTDSNLFINQEDFDYDLKFIDSNEKLYYLISKYDYTTDKEIVLMQGKLNGYNSDTDYQYRLNFERFINIKNNNIEWNDEFYQWDNEYTYFKRIKENICKLNIYFDNTDTILNNNPNSYTTNTNGNIVITGSVTSYYNFTSTFYDKYTDDLNVFPTNKLFYNNQWFAVGSYTPSSSDRIVIEQLNSYNEVIYNNELFGTGEGNLRQYFVYVLNGTKKIRFRTLLKPQWITYEVKSKCNITPVYFWNDGVLDTIYSEGNKIENDEITKNNITVNNKLIPISILIQKNIKLNTGYSLEDKQMFNLIKSPSIILNSDDYGYIENPARNYMGSTSNINIDKIGSNTSLGVVTKGVTGYNLNNSGINLFSITNDSSVNLFRMYINDLPITLSEDYYYLTFWWKHVAGTNLNLNININDQSLTTLNEPFTENVWKYYEGYIYIDNRIGDTFYIDFEPLFTGGVNNSIILSDIQFGKGKKMYPYSQSYTETGQNKLKFKYYNLEEKTFESYLDKNLSDRNIELNLKLNKTYVQKTNVKLNFLD